jgi:hypothetical protein
VYYVLTESILPIAASHSFSWRPISLHLVLIAIFGIVLPQRKGIGFLDPVIISAYACMGIIFAAPAAAARFAKSRPQSLNEVFGRAWQAAAYGEGMALLLLATGVATVNFNRNGRVWLPELDTLGASAALGLTGTIAMALLTGWLTLRFSPVTAQLGTRLLFVLLLLAFFFQSQRLPEIALAGSIVCLAVSAGLAYLLYREVNPR